MRQGHGPSEEGVRTLCNLQLGMLSVLGGDIDMGPLIIYLEFFGERIWLRLAIFQDNEWI